ncbi:hypothetical protein EV138_6302 [Kribbella voronezhensis]|uniref:Uncharacterized protein n=1 Tax=Kribbella voronezhensis TaxID=2512212 RepID=A0A4R7SZ66_9ACTN|nr:hypothetical protein [Kribbella voronezhensis]TDU83838.1 hypothetical protein EV138_6302 [Kribbella voronezhensis]
MTEQRPLPKKVALAAVGRCLVTTLQLLLQRRIHQPREHVGTLLRFADGTEGRVYRETVIDRPPAADPCVLVVAFRLRGVRGAGHTLFRWESWCNTPLFAGFPGLISKLWLAHDESATYRGFYEWDGAESAEAYARALWRILELVSEPGSIHYHVLPGIHRDEVLADPDLLTPADDPSWWRLVGTR